MPKMLGFREICKWIAENDDITFLDSDNPILTVTGSMVCHLFNKTEDEVIKEIRRQAEKYK